MYTKYDLVLTQERTNEKEEGVWMFSLMPEQECDSKLKVHLAALVTTEKYMT